MSEAIAAESPSKLPFLPRLIREPRRPLRTILGGYLLSVGGSLLVAAVISALVANPSAPNFDFLKGSGFFAVFVLSVLTPLIETLILAATTSILLRFVSPGFAILLSSFGWALAHSYQAPIWGLVIWWPFIIFTTLYIVWKQRSLAWGLFMPYAVHFLQNLLPAISIGYPELLPAIS